MTKKDKNDPLLLENQVCFPLYACARRVVNTYASLLKELDLTYTQYVTMMVMWEHEKISVKDLGAKLYLDSGTLTPVRFVRIHCGGTHPKLSCAYRPFLLYYTCIFMCKGLDGHERKADIQTNGVSLKGIESGERRVMPRAAAFCVYQTESKGGNRNETHPIPAPRPGALPGLPACAGPCRGGQPLRQAGQQNGPLLRRPVFRL